MALWALLLIAILLICVRLYISPPTKWCRSQRCLVGKTAIITGANSGIGFETALDFAKRGAKVILGCRDKKRAEEARRKIIEKSDNINIFVKIIDMSCFESVRGFAKEINKTEKRLDILVNNAGVTCIGGENTKDGHNFVMQVNYYSHFLLTNLLLELMKKSDEPTRIVNVSSVTAAYFPSLNVDNLDKFPGNVTAYSNSKLCNILFTKELATKLQNTNITTYSLHPGAIKTDLLRYSQGFGRAALHLGMGLIEKPVEDGAQTIIYCSVEKNLEKFSGQHFDNCRNVADYRAARVPGLPRKIWELTEDIVQLKNEEKSYCD